MGHRKSLTQAPERRGYKPEYNLARTFKDTSIVAPPFQFTGVTMHVFPLRANLNRLQSVVDESLNNVFPDSEAYWFRAFIPYVYLMLVNYGKMSLDAANVGWIAQREILFTIPLEWYVSRGGRYVFHDWAQVSPFIFVDNTMSMSLGREVYGWPKQLVWLDSEGSPPWMEDPVAPFRLASVSARVLPQLYQGQHPEKRVFLEVYKDALDSVTQVPLNPHISAMPWTMASNLASLGASLVDDSVELMRGMRFFAQDPKAAQSDFARMGHGLARMMNPTSPDVYFNCINLKQYRDAESPDMASYQAVVNSTMDIRRINRAGLLGGVGQLQADSSGGIQISLHRYASLPIVETLGLQVEREVRTNDTSIALLRPLFPYWANVDMTYGQGEVLTEQAAPLYKQARDSDKKNPLRIRNIGGLLAQQLIGPIDWPNTTLRVMPLLADEKKLEAYCNEYLNDTLANIAGGLKVRFEPWGNYVYLMAFNHEMTVSSQNNVGHQQDRDLMLYLPVRVFAQKAGEKEEKLHTVALLPVLSYSNDDLVANSTSEVQGIPTTCAQLDDPPSSWMGEAGPAKHTPTRLLEVSTLVFPALGQGQQAENRKVLEIRTGDVVAYNDDIGQRSVKRDWGGVLLEDFHKRLNFDEAQLQASHALALEVLANGFPINIITLKQARDAVDPNKACYQSLVGFDVSINKVFDLREIEDTLTVRIYDASSQRIMDTLGIIPKQVNYEGPSFFYDLQPVRPFWMRVSMRGSLGRILFRRSDSEQWTPIDFFASEEEKKHYFESVAREPQSNEPSEPGSNATGFNPWEVLEGPQRLSERVSKWRRATKWTHRKLPIPNAENAVNNIPLQWVLESILSLEWEHWGNPRRIAKSRKQYDGKLKPLFCLPFKDLPKDQPVAREHTGNTWYCGEKQAQLPLGESKVAWEPSPLWHSSWAT